VLRALVVDDEAPARRKLARLLGRHADVEIVGEAASAAEALTQVRERRPDVVFLDVQMPGTDGVALASELFALETRPRFVFVTAHAEHALRAFELEALDYVLKPVDDDRLGVALERLRRVQAAQTVSPDQLAQLIDRLREPEPYRERILVERDERSYFVSVRDIVWIEADRNDAVLHCAGTMHVVRGTLDRLERMLDPRAFARINRSSVVRIDAIRELRTWFHGEYKVVLNDGTTLTWTRRYVGRRPELLSRF
jgi:two-component system LytT family response regulator